MNNFKQVMREKIATHLSIAKQSRPYLDFVSDEANVDYLRELLKEVMLEVFWYASRITEAVFLAIGRMPKDRPDLMKRVAQIALTEANHFKMAFRDYAGLGGDGEWAMTARPSRASLVVGAVCRELAERQDPFSVLGVMYLIEGIAPDLNAAAQRVIERRLSLRNAALPASEFVAAHAEEDIAHTRYMERVIMDVAAAFPASAPAIEYGADCFALVYPLPIWQGAWERASAALDGKAPPHRPQ